MRPELIPGWPIHSYGLMLVVAFYSAYFIARWRARREGIDPERMTDILLIAAVSGIVGARVLYIIQYRDQIKGVLDFFAIWKGGLVFYGGLILAIISLSIYVARKKLPLWKVADAAAPAIMIGLAIGRIGCFLNGCCWGERAEDNFPLAVRFPKLVAISADTSFLDHNWRIESLDARVQIRKHEELVQYVAAHPSRDLFLRWYRGTRTKDGAPAIETITGSYAFLQHLAKYPTEIGPDDTKSLPVHPTQLYETCAALLIFGLVLAWARWRRRPGEMFALMGLLYAVARFSIEKFRLDTPSIVGSLTMGQAISVGIFAIALAGFIYFRFGKRAV